MDILSPFLALGTVLVFSVFLVLKAKVPAAFAPLVSLSFTAMWFALFGMLGLLVAGGWAYYIIATIVLIFTFAYKPQQNDLKKLRTPAFAFFAVAAVFAVLYLAIRQPMLHEWDEFSFWGTAVKIVKLSGDMYTTANVGWNWLATQMPTLPMLGYFTQFFGAFAAWKIYVGYAFLMLSIVTALVGTISKKNWSIAVPAAFIGLLTPWFFTVYARQYETNFVWLSSYGDLPAAMMFGGALVCYFGLRRENAPLWPMYIVLAATTCAKENTFILSLLAAGIIAVDLVLFRNKYENPPGLLNRAKDWLKPPFKRSFKTRAGHYTLFGSLARGTSYLAAAILPYLVWNRYIAYLLTLREQAGEVASTSPPLEVVLLNCLKMLFGFKERTEQFSLALKNMTEAYFSFDNEFSMLGGNILLTAFILSIFALAIVFAGNGKLRRQALTATVLSTLGFVGYYFQLIFSYGAIFKYEQAAGLASYNRYVQTYYIGWFLLAVSFLLAAVRTKIKRYSPARAVALLLALFMVVRAPMLLPLQNSDIGYPDAYFEEHRMQESRANSILDAIEDDENARIFFVHQNDHYGLKWFYYSYYLLPAVLDESIGGGRAFALPQENTYFGYEYVSVKEMQEYIETSGCNYVMIEYVDEDFTKSYGELFSDNLYAVWNKATLLYHVVGSGADLHMEPVEMEVPRIV